MYAHRKDAQERMTRRVAIVEKGKIVMHGEYCASTQESDTGKTILPLVLLCALCVLRASVLG